MPTFFPKKYLVIFLIIFFLLADAHLALAASKKCKFAAASGINPVMVIKCILEEFGIKDSTVRKAAQMVEVAENKKTPPQVTLTFNPTAPIPGEKVTAIALPTYFGNQLQSLYYTWYLKSAICPDNKAKCDLNNDGDVDIEDYKIKAMRIYASGGFEWQEINYNDASLGDDADGYSAIHGGEDQQGKANHCYFHDTASGNQYKFPSCFHLFPNAPGKTTGDGSFSKEEEQFWHTNPDNPDTAQTGHLDEANVAGLGASNFSWTYQSGDEIGVTVEGTSFEATSYKDSSYKIMWATLKNDCEISSENFDDPTGTESNYETQLDPLTWPDCPDGCEFTRTLTKQKPSTNQDSSGYTTTGSQYLLKTETIQLASRRRTTDGTSMTNSLTLPTAGTYQQSGTCNKIDTDSLVDSGFFTQAEVDSVIFNPNDERRVALLTNRSCCPEDFDAGDGTAACTITYSNTEIVDSIGGSTDDLFNMGRKSFSQCLMDNMIAPTEGGGKNERLEVSLSSYPENPVNDTSPEGHNADWISISSIIENATQNESLHYSWKVFAGDSSDPEDEGWDLLIKSQLNGVGVGQTEGTGIPNLKFKANFYDPVPRYLKIKLNVSEKVVSGLGTRNGHAELIVPLSSFNNRLTVFNALVDNSLKLSQGSEEICKIHAGENAEDLVDAAICQVAPDQIVAVKANVVPIAGESWDDYDLFWTLNGQALSYKYVSDFDKPGNLIFFPVLTPRGSALNLSLEATNQKTGTRMNLNKAFLVSEPAFKISSTDEDTAIPKILGHYLDLEGKKWPDYSQTEFFALKDSTIKLSVEQFASNPLPAEEDISLSWHWNNIELDENERTLSFNAPSDTTESFYLSAEGLYTQDINTKKALNAYWNVPINGFYEKFLSQKINFSVVDSISKTTTVKNDQQKILASFISNVPAYFAFLFRMVMTTFVLISTIWILLALFPQNQKND